MHRFPSDIAVHILSANSFIGWPSCDFTLCTDVSGYALTAAAKKNACARRVMGLGALVFWLAIFLWKCKLQTYYQKDKLWRRTPWESRYLTEATPRPMRKLLFRPQRSHDFGWGGIRDFALESLRKIHEGKSDQTHHKRKQRMPMWLGHLQSQKFGTHRLHQVQCTGVSLEICRVCSAQWYNM